jgi:hypothetical protein
VELPAGWHKANLPFLFDAASMPDRQAACAHCPPHEDPMLCCGVCAFGGHSCDDEYPGQGKSAALARQFSGSGFRLRVSGAALCIFIGIPQAHHRTAARLPPQLRRRLPQQRTELPACRRLMVALPL